MQDAYCRALQDENQNLSSALKLNDEAAAEPLFALFEMSSSVVEMVVNKIQDSLGGWQGMFKDKLRIQICYQAFPPSWQTSGFEAVWLRERRGEEGHLGKLASKSVEELKLPS